MSAASDDDPTDDLDGSDASESSDNAFDRVLDDLSSVILISNVTRTVTSFRIRLWHP